MGRRQLRRRRPRAPPPRRGTSRRAALKNGDLLTRAQQEFDTFVTVDRNLPFQQDLSRFSIAIIVLRARSTRVRDLRSLIPQLLAGLPAVRRGEVTWIGAEQRV
jgi:hypothetical protein